MSSLLFKLSLYSSVLNLIFTPLSSALARLFGYLTIILFFVSVVQSVLKGGKITLNKVVLGFIIAVIVSFSVSINSLAVNSVGDFIDNLLSVFSFVMFYIALSTEQKNSQVMTLEDIFLINNVMCVMLIIFAFVPFDFRYQVVDEYGSMVFTMGLGNPNGVSLYVMFAIVFSMIQFYTTKKTIVKVFDIAMIAVLFYIMYLLSSRTVLFCTLLVAIAFLFRLPKVFKWISYCAVVAPVFTLMMQMQLLSVDNLAIQILGKSIDTGRPEIYTRVLDDLTSSPIKVLFGDLCSYYFENTHNGLLTVMATLGLVGVFLYILFWYQQMKKLRNICTQRSQIIAFITLIAVLIHASSESMGVVGTIPFCIFVVVIMRIAKGEIRSRYD